MSGAWDGFTQTSVETWGLGSYDSPAVVFNGVDVAGVEWICGTPDGWDTTTLDVPLTEGAGDGGWFSPGRRKPKVLTLRGAFRGDPALVEVAAGQLRQALEVTQADTYLWFDGAYSVPLQMGVRATGEVSIERVVGNPRIRTFTAVLTADDPLKYSAGIGALQSFTIKLATTSGSAGLTFPMAAPFDFGGGISGGRLTLTVLGTAPCYPLVTIAGPVDTPVLRRNDTGASIGVSRVLAGSDSVVIDHRARSLLLNGASIYTQRVAGSSFFALSAGRNDLTFSANAYAAGTATLTYRPAWA